MARREIIYGVNPVCEVLRSGRRKCSAVYVADGKKEVPLQDLLKAAEDAGVKVRQVDRHVIDKMAGDKKHQGVIAEVDGYPYVTLDEIVKAASQNQGEGLILVLDGITDPQNLGSIVRTAHQIGVDGIMIPQDKSAEVTSAAVKASAGATEYTLIVKVINITREIEHLKKKGYWVGGALGEDGESLYRHDFKGEKTVIVIGSEGSGMRRLVKEKCDYLISIPMKGKVGSYNASVATAIIISEISRQRQK